MIYVCDVVFSVIDFSDLVFEQVETCGVVSGFCDFNGQRQPYVAESDDCGFYFPLLDFIKQLFFHLGDCEYPGKDMPFYDIMLFKDEFLGIFTPGYPK